MLDADLPCNPGHASTMLVVRLLAPDARVSSKVGALVTSLADVLTALVAIGAYLARVTDPGDSNSVPDLQVSDLTAHGSDNSHSLMACDSMRFPC